MDPNSAADLVVVILISLFFVGMFAPAIAHRMKARKNAGRAEQEPEVPGETAKETAADGQRDKRSKLAA